MEGLNGEQLAQAVRRKIKRPLYAMLVGDHLTGIVAQRAAYSLAGAMLVPARGLLGLRPMSDVKERQVEVEGFPALLRFLDLKAELDAIASTRNTEALERLHAPVVVIDGPELQEVRRVARSFVTKAAYHDVVARAAKHREAAVPGAPVHEALEAARLLLFGAHLLSTGEFRSNLNELLPPGKTEWVDALRARQAAEGLQATLGEEEARAARHGLPPLEDRLGMALATSELPEAGGSISELDEFLVELRIREIREEC